MLPFLCLFPLLVVAQLARLGTGITNSITSTVTPTQTVTDFGPSGTIFIPTLRKGPLITVSDFCLLSCQSTITNALARNAYNSQGPFANSSSAVTVSGPLSFAVALPAEPPFYNILGRMTALPQGPSC